MGQIGASAARSSGGELLARARARAALLPDLLVEAQRIANVMTPGWHGRKRRGIGEEFWQYRPYSVGETVARIDWRRSARDEHVYVRDLEWEAAHTIWLWADPSPSMLFQSKLATISKENRALVVVLALTEILSRSGERIAYPQVFAPTSSRHGAERLATSLFNIETLNASPDLGAIGRHSECVYVSDFLDPVEEIIEKLDPLAGRAVRVHLVEVTDPAEETFPYVGRTEFVDPETGLKLIAGRADNLAVDYKNLYFARREELARFAKAKGWSYTITKTDSLASTALVQLFGALSKGAHL